MKDKKEKIANLFCEEFKKSLEKTDKLQFTKTPFLNSIGQELVKFIKTRANNFL